MHKPRWYPTLTELADGRYVAISGNATDATHWADTPEVYDPATNTWTLLTGVSTPQVHEEEYPFSYLLPDGKVFTIGPNEDNSFVLDVDAQTWTPTGGASGVRNGSSVMYRPGKILYSGGGAERRTPPARRRRPRAVIDLTAATPAWQPTAPMASARIYHTLTMLADGTVLAVGGEPNSRPDASSPPACCRPRSGTRRPRRWSTGALDGGGPQLPLDRRADARRARAGRRWRPPARHRRRRAVLVADLLAVVPVQRARGPTITAASAARHLRLGRSRCPLPTPRRSASVNLVSLGADTHQIDMNQHFVPLSFTASGSGRCRSRRRPRRRSPRPATTCCSSSTPRACPSVASMVQHGAHPTAPAARPR